MDTNKVVVNIDADKFETCATILLSRYSDFDKTKYKLVLLSITEDDTGKYIGQLIVRERQDEDTNKVDIVL